VKPVPSFIAIALLMTGHVTTVAEPPNIVHIVADDLGWNDVGFHGSEIKTPIIDQLASESVVLDRFYVTPICSPTRAGVLTGRYPFRYGIWGGVVSPQKRHGLPPRESTTPELLAGCGYGNRGMFGKWHLGLASTMFHPLNHGFTHFYGHYNGAIDYFSRERFGQLDWHRNFDRVHEEGYSTDLIGHAAAEFIDTHGGRSPFYAYVAFNAPHSPIQAKRSDLEKYGFDPAGKRAPNTDRNIAKREKAPHYGERGKGNTVRQTFSAMVSSLDQNIGLILRALERHGIDQNTIVILHSDNGADPRHGGSNRPLRGNKFTTWEGGVRVVAMIRWPARFEGGVSYKSVTSYVDVLPTLLAAAGEEAPENIDGMNLLPFLEGKQTHPERLLLLGKDAVVSDRWKMRAGEVFDLKHDPLETQSVKSPPADILAKLHARVADFGVMTGPKTLTRLSQPRSWPPPEWKLPEENSIDASDSGH